MPFWKKLFIFTSIALATITVCSIPGLNDLRIECKPLAAMAVETGIQITGIETNLDATVEVGDTVQLTIHTIVQGGAEVHYQFFLRAGYGEPEWGGNRWTVVQDYSPANSVEVTFDEPGTYFLVGHVEYPGETWSAGDPQSGLVVEVRPAPISYENLFIHGTLHEIEIIISQEEWDGHIQDMKDYAENDLLGLGRTGKYRRATFVYRGPGQGQIVEEVGFRTKGNASRIIPQEIDDVTGEHGAFHRAHFKVKFNEKFDLEKGTDEYEERDDRRFCRLRKLDFRLNTFTPPWWDNSYIRQYHTGVLTQLSVRQQSSYRLDGSSGTYLGKHPQYFTADRYGLLII